MVSPLAIRTAGSPKGIFVLLLERYMPTRERANVVWKTTMVRKIGPVCCISYACMSENTEQVTLRSKYEENDFQETSRQNAVMMLAIQETSRCGAVMTLESKFTFTSFDKETVLSFIPCHSIRCILLLYIHIIFCSRPLNKNNFFFMIGGENTRWTYDYMCELLYSRLNISC